MKHDPNGHTLYRHEGPGPIELCSRLRRRSDAELSFRRDGAGADDVRFVEMMTTLDRDFPHGDSCVECHGTNVKRQSVTLYYWCSGCDSTGHLADFDLHSCLALGAGFYAEQRELHRLWHLSDETSVTGCSLCATARLEARAARRAEAARVESEAIVAGLEAYRQLLTGAAQ